MWWPQAGGPSVHPRSVGRDREAECAGAPVLSPRRDCWVSLRVDGASVVRRVMRAGEREFYGARAEIVLNVGDAGAFAFAINQRAGRALGASGQVVTVRMTPQNYDDGEFNWSSQHLDDEVLRWRNGNGDGQTEQVGLRCVRPVARG